MKPIMRAILVFAVVAAIYIAATPTAAVSDTWTSIPDNEIRDTDIQGLGRWAVTEHAKQANDGVRFNRVVSGFIRKAYKGVNYRFIIDASNNAGKGVKYEAVVYDKDWRGSRLLISFKPAN